MLPSQMERYTKTAENQNLNDFLLHVVTLALINFALQKLIPNNKDAILSKTCCFPEIYCIR